MISIEVPGWKTIHIENLLMDFNGTLAIDGNLIHGVRGRLESLSLKVNHYILTADTFGMVEESCAGLPVKIQKIEKGEEALQKKIFLEKLGPEITAAIGNGANDFLMLERACLGILALGGEGLCIKCIHTADILVPDICAGLDLFLYPKRIQATLRE